MQFTLNTYINTKTGEQARGIFADMEGDGESTLIMTLNVKSYLPQEVERLAAQVVALMNASTNTTIA